MMGKTPHQNRVCSPSQKADAGKGGVLELAFRQEAGWPTLANHKSLITIFCGAVAFEVESLCWRAGDGFRFLIAGLAITGLAVINSKKQETTNLREVY